MNIFKQKEQEITTGFYYDRAKNKIAYCYVDHKSEYFGNISIYNRDSNNSDYMFAYNNSSRVNNLTDITLELLTNNINSTIFDFKWLSSEEHIEQEFIEFLKRQELYLVIKMFIERDKLLPKMPVTNNKVTKKNHSGIIILK